MTRLPPTLAVIPARYASHRFPGKPLANIDGLPMIVHVAQRVREAEQVGRVMVATDDERILNDRPRSRLRSPHDSERLCSRARIASRTPFASSAVCRRW